MTVGQSESGVVYQVLQHRAGDGLGVGVDEVRVTSVSANSFASETCVSPPLSSSGSAHLEALASGPIGGARPVDMAYKSTLIADASSPCFASAALGGLGRVCIGPDCSGSCDCADEADCAAFSIGDGVSLDTATPEIPGAVVVAPIQLAGQYCNVSNGLAYGFGSAGHLTAEGSVCGAAPGDGIRLVDTPSAFDGGRDGTSIVIAYSADPGETVAIAAAGFGIDNDGQNPFDCDAPGRVVAALQATGDDAPSEAPPLPPVNLDAAERRCQRAIGRAGRRFSGRVLRALQLCRDRILNGTWQIRAERCLAQPLVARTLKSAARVARTSIRARCGALDMGTMLTCGDRVDDLVTPDLEAGCLFETHRNLAEQMAVLEYGF